MSCTRSSRTAALGVTFALFTTACGDAHKAVAPELEASLSGYYDLVLVGSVPVPFTHTADGCEVGGDYFENASIESRVDGAYMYFVSTSVVEIAAMEMRRCVFEDGSASAWRDEGATGSGYYRRVGGEIRFYSTMAERDADTPNGTATLAGNELLVPVGTGMSLTYRKR